MPRRPLSPAQIAHQLTWQLDGYIRDLAAMRLQALRGTLTDDEFRALRERLRREVAPLRALLTQLKSLARDASRVADVPEAATAALDEAIRAVEQALGSNRETAKLLGPRQIMLARKALEDGSVIV